jgi:GMP synthase (glutamine-hydrolysing)
MKIYVIDNGGQWTHREWRVLRDLDVETKIVNKLTEKVDGLILSGGPMRISSSTLHHNCFNLNIPILGICAGHQYIAKHFGGKVEPSVTPEFGKAELLINGRKDKLIEGIPKQSIVWESHNDEVTILPKDFVLLGSSESCKIQMMRHKTKPIYGLQFHPEVEHTECGEQLFKNFIEICSSFKC